jgi:hypothetical protein
MDQSQGWPRDTNASLGIFGNSKFGDKGPRILILLEIANVNKIAIKF